MEAQLILVVEIFAFAAMFYAVQYLIGSMRKKRVLIVEDSDFDQETLKALLKHPDYKLLFYSSFKSARNHLVFRAFRPDMALIDKNLPDEDGQELYRLCKSECIPVKMYTADGNEMPGIPSKDIFHKGDPSSFIKVREWVFNQKAA